MKCVSVIILVMGFLVQASALANLPEGKWFINTYSCNIHSQTPASSERSSTADSNRASTAETQASQPDLMAIYILPKQKTPGLLRKRVGLKDEYRYSIRFFMGQGNHCQLVIPARIGLFSGFGDVLEITTGDVYYFVSDLASEGAKSCEPTEETVKLLLAEKTHLTAEELEKLRMEKVEHLRLFREFISNRLRKTAYYAFSVRTRKRDGRKRMKIEVNQDPFYCGSGGGVHRFLDRSKDLKNIKE